MGQLTLPERGIPFDDAFGASSGYGEGILAHRGSRNKDRPRNDRRSVRPQAVAICVQPAQAFRSGERGVQYVLASVQTVR
jgi:hypothetical protein